MKVRILAYVALGIALYFGNVAVQSYLGRRAFAETGLPAAPLAETLAAAKQNGRFVIADVSAEWCPSCRHFDRAVLSEAPVKQKIRDAFQFTRIEYESETGVALRKQFSLRGIPSLLVLDGDGRLITQLTAGDDPDYFLEQLNEVLVKKEASPGLTR